MPERWKQRMESKASALDGSAKAKAMNSRILQLKVPFEVPPEN